jgi:hypothetical protein
MKGFKWNLLKSKRLKRTRGVSFEEIVTAKIIDLKDNPHRQNQQMLLFEYRNYIWLVPCVETETHLFLKTLYPSRKYTKLYKKEISNEKNQIDQARKSC